MVLGFLSKKESDKKIIKNALKVLGKKKLALIIHSNSFPAVVGEDTGFGTINSSAGKNLIDFVSGIFNTIQLGPAGKTKSCDSSPYTSTIFSANPLFIDLKQLTQKEWFNLLSVDTFNEIVNDNPNENKGKTAYSYIVKAQERALKEVFENYKNTTPKKLENEFIEYKKENKSWLDNDALYEALSLENNNDYWPMWKNETDKHLLNPSSNEERMNYGNRIQEIEKKYANEIEFYKFCQFVIYKQNEDTKSYAQKKGIKMIADRQVAFSDRDTWAYQSLFLDGWLLGCPPDYFSKDGQAWGFPVLDPEKLFNSDGSLGKGGKLLKALYKKMFKENQGGVRIDHIVGLIDPWVYKKGKKPKESDGAGRLYSSPEHEELSKYAVISEDNLNNDVPASNELRVKDLNEKQIELYARTIEHIVLAAAKEEGVDINSIVCEDLGTLTNPVAKVMEKYKLLGMKLTQFVDPEMQDHPYRGKNIVKNTWAMTGTHDNKPILMWADELVNTHIGYLHAKNLVEDVFPNAKNKDDIIVRMTKDVNFLTQCKFAELFTSDAENIQIFFTDYFGLREIYNKPGTSGDENWSLRLPNDFEKLYKANLASGIAFNLPLVLSVALEAKDEKFVQKHSDLIKKLKEIA